MRDGFFKSSLEIATITVLVLGSTVLNAATTSFTVDIKNRGTSPPAALVKITLQTGSTTSLSTLSVNGTNVPGVLILPNGDKVIAASQPGQPNNFQILYQPLGQLAGNDWCHYAPSHDGIETISFTFTGPAVSGYRITTYSTAGSAGIVATDCSHAQRRVDTNKAVVSMITSGVDLGREPQDIILVLDASGSMSAPPPGDPDPNTHKWTVLTNAVGAFIGAWELVDADASHQNDRIGLMFYSTTVDAPSFAGSIS